MGKAKVSVLILTLVGIYFVAAGGFRSVVTEGASLLEVVARPVQGGNPFDTALIMTCLVLFAWALLPWERGNRFSRTPLLKGVALASALVATGSLVMLLSERLPDDPRMIGIVGTMALIQGFVGCTAATLMLCRAESRRASVIPLLLNGGLTTGAIMLVCAPLFA